MKSSKEALLVSVRARCEQAIVERVFSGCVLGLILPNSSVEILAIGHNDYVISKAHEPLRGETLESVRPLNQSSIFDIASVTKSVPVGTLALKRILAGTLDPQAPVMNLLPELHTNYREQVRVCHLLTHSLDYRFPMSSLKNLSAEMILQNILTHQFTAEPGTLFNYGNAASLLLGLLLERSTGETLPSLAEKELFTPLGMTRTGWNPLARFDSQEIVPTEFCAWRNRIIRGEVHDESAYALQSQGAVGSAGVFSTVPDLCCVVQMLLQNGEWMGSQILPFGVLDLLTQNALQDVPGASTALGWELCNRRFMGSACSPKTFGKTGFTGSCIIADPERNSALVLLSNFTWPKREASVERIYQVRAALADLLFAG